MNRGRKLDLRTQTPPESYVPKILLGPVLYSPLACREVQKFLIQADVPLCASHGSPVVSSHTQSSDAVSIFSEKGWPQA